MPSLGLLRTSQGVVDCILSVGFPSLTYGGKLVCSGEHIRFGISYFASQNFLLAVLELKILLVGMDGDREMFLRAVFARVCLATF
jgi:hypothetical protein